MSTQKTAIIYPDGTQREPVSTEEQKEWAKRWLRERLPEWLKETGRDPESHVPHSCATCRKTGMAE